jgi:phosphoribosyl-dephospho-CoA transferase
MVNSLVRHDLAWLDPAQVGALEVEPLHHPTVARWIEAGLPAVATRRGQDGQDGAAWLGIPLPPSRGKLRIALRAPVRAVLRARPPLRLAEVVSSAPAVRRGALEALDAEAQGLGILLRVHGSLAWQHLTGEPYLTARSDLDLLLEAGSRWRLGAALRMLQRWEWRTGLVADAEIRLPAGGVAWRELVSGVAQLLVKQEAGVTLLARDELMATLPAGGAP